MSQFKRGDRVEALFGTEWKPALCVYAGNSGCEVSLDDDQCRLYWAAPAEIRRPPRKVKRMMQALYMDGRFYMAESDNKFHNATPVGEKIEMEFEVPNE